MMVGRKKKRSNWYQEISGRFLKIEGMGMVRRS
jgi:hypothetical protein